MYFDNAATSWPKPPEVVKAMSDYLVNYGVSASRSCYRMALTVEEQILETRELLAELINAPYATQMVFTANTTESLNLAIQGVLRPGDSVITTVTEHNSVIRPLWKLAQSGVIDVTWVPCDENGLVNPDDIQKALKPSTRMVIVNNASNVTGAVQPLEKIGEITRAANVLFLVDAAQTIGYIPIDIQSINADLIAFPGHKGLRGPSGTGALYVNPNVDVQPLKLGGSGILSELLEQPEGMPTKLESGTPNIVGILGLRAALQFLKKTGLQTIHEHEQSLIQRLIMGLNTIPNVRVYGDADMDRVGVVSFNIDGMFPGRIGAILDTQHDFQVRVGLHCSPMIHEYIGTAPYGTVRVSPGYFNTANEIDTFVEAVREISVTQRPFTKRIRIPASTASYVGGDKNG